MKQTQVARQKAGLRWGAFIVMRKVTQFCNWDHLPLTFPSSFLFAVFFVRLGAVLKSFVFFHLLHFIC